MIHRFVPLLAAATLVGLLAGCFSTSAPATNDPYYDLRSDDTPLVIDATRSATRNRDWRAVPHLIQNLRHDDQWVRYMSCQALLVIRNSPDTLGYHFIDPEDQREAAVKRWETWYDEEKTRRAG